MTEVLHAENDVMDTCVLKAEELRTEKEKKPTKKKSCEMWLCSQDVTWPEH